MKTPRRCSLVPIEIGLDATLRYVTHALDRDYKRLLQLLPNSVFPSVAASAGSG